MGLANAPGQKVLRLKNGKWWLVNIDLNIWNGPLTDAQVADELTRCFKGDV